MANTEQQMAEKKNIVLIGFMGSGKTVVGRHLARELDYDFVDTDEAIADVTGMPLPRLIKKHGEIRFRSEEELVIRKLSQKEHQVVACGGSISEPSGQRLQPLKEQGYFVLLQAPPEVILQRISRKSNRAMPLSRVDKENIAALLEQRQQPYVENADLIVNTGEISVEEAALLIAEQYRRCCGIS